MDIVNTVAMQSNDSKVGDGRVEDIPSEELNTLIG